MLSTHRRNDRTYRFIKVRELVAASTARSSNNGLEFVHSENWELVKLKRVFVFSSS